MPVLLQTGRLIYLAVLGLLFSCSAYQTEGDYFFLKSDGVDFPVWVQGNTKTDRLVIFMHGGPGGDALIYHQYASFRAIEQNFAIVYWDQRGSGFSQGSASVTTALTPETLAKDLHRLVTLVRNRYPGKKIFLLGHSFGGRLSAQYVENPAYQSSVDGLMLVNAFISPPVSYRYSRGLMMSYASQHSADQNWKDALDWYTANPELTSLEQWNTHSGFINEKTDWSQYYDADGAEIHPYDPEFALASPANFAGLLNPPNSWGVLQSTDPKAWFSQYFSDLIPGLSTVTLPTLVLWGNFDEWHRPEVATEIFNALGTADANKQVQLFANSAHSPMGGDSQEFGEAVVNFVAKN